MLKTESASKPRNPSEDPVSLWIKDEHETTSELGEQWLYHPSLNPTRPSVHPGSEFEVPGRLESTSRQLIREQIQIYRDVSIPDEELEKDRISEAERIFIDALTESKEEGEPKTSNTALVNALEVAKAAKLHCPRLVVEFEASDGAMYARVENKGDWITVKCEPGGGVLVIFDVGSSARIPDFGNIESGDFLSKLLKSLQY